MHIALSNVSALVFDNAYINFRLHHHQIEIFEEVFKLLPLLLKDREAIVTLMLLYVGQIDLCCAAGAN